MEQTSIKINPYTDDADQAWDLIEKSVQKKSLKPLDLNTPIYPNKVIYHLSDLQTNNYTKQK